MRLLTISCLFLVASAATPASMFSHLNKTGLLRKKTAPPSWPQSWAVANSTVTYGCNYSGYFDPAYIAQFALVALDWSHGKEVWANEHPMDGEALLLEQVLRIRANRPNTITMVYRNTVKALSWFSHVREKIIDPAFAGWFLPYNTNATAPFQSPACDPVGACSTLYHDQMQTPQPLIVDDGSNGTCTLSFCDSGGPPTGEFLWDLRNASAREYMLENILGPTALGNDAITGLYLDDYWSPHQAVDPSGNQPPWGYCTYSPIGGPSEISFNCIEDMALTASDVSSLTAAWTDSFSHIMDVMDDAGALSFFSFDFASTPSPSQIGSALTTMCSTGTTGPVYNSLLYLTLSTPNSCCPPTRNTTLLSFAQDLVYFQLIRGPFAWIGYTWDFCAANHEMPDGLFLNYGDPMGTCSESAPGIFTREFEHATAVFNVTDFTAAMVMK